MTRVLRTDSGGRASNRSPIIDVPDLETLAALVEEGLSLAGLIRRKATGSYAQMDLRRFVREAPDLPGPVRLSTVEDQWRRSMRHAIDLYGFEPDEDQLAERHGE